MNLLYTKLIAYKLDYHWYFIGKTKEKMNLMYAQGADLLDERMLSLNQKFNHHYVKAAELDRLFLAVTTPKNK